MALDAEQQLVDDGVQRPVSRDQLERFLLPGQHPVGAAAVGQVVRTHHHRADDPGAVDERRPVHLEHVRRLAAACHPDLEAGMGQTLERRLEELEEPRLIRRDDPGHEGLADDRVGRPGVDHPQCGAVDVQDSPVGSDGDHALGRLDDRSRRAGRTRGVRIGLGRHGRRVRGQPQRALAGVAPGGGAEVPADECRCAGDGGSGSQEGQRGVHGRSGNSVNRQAEWTAARSTPALPRRYRRRRTRLECPSCCRRPDVGAYNAEWPRSLRVSGCTPEIPDR